MSAVVLHGALAHAVGKHGAGFSSREGGDIDHAFSHAVEYRGDRRVWQHTWLEADGPNTRDAFLFTEPRQASVDDRCHRGILSDTADSEQQSGGCHWRLVCWAAVADQKSV
jgi:hypothetical protein